MVVIRTVLYIQDGIINERLHIENDQEGDDKHIPYVAIKLKKIIIVATMNTTADSH